RGTRSARSVSDPALTWTGALQALAGTAQHGQHAAKAQRRASTTPARNRRPTNLAAAAHRFSANHRILLSHKTPSNVEEGKSGVVAGQLLPNFRDSPIRFTTEARRHGGRVLLE